MARRIARRVGHTLATVGYGYISTPVLLLDIGWQASIFTNGLGMKSRWQQRASLKVTLSDYASVPPYLFLEWGRVAFH